MKHVVSIGIVALLLSACTAGNSPSTQAPTVNSASSASFSFSSTLVQNEGGWQSYESRELGISFSHPSAYSHIETETGGTMQLRDGQIVFDAVVASVPGGGESAQIRVLKTGDPKIVQSLSEQPLETVVIAGKTVQRFADEGMGTPAGFVQRIGEDYVVLTFVFPPSEEVMDRVLVSLNPL